MIQIYNYEDWIEYKGAAEGSGRSEKIWLIDKKTERIGLFKFPKVSKGQNKYAKPSTTEHVSEKLAASIAQELHIPSARIEIGQRDNRIGCMSYLIPQKKEGLIEGIYLINLTNPNFNREKLYDPTTQEYYSYELIMRARDKIFTKINEKKIFTANVVTMMFFDMLIGNTDRHQSNWGIIGQIEKKDLKLRFCPLYDNGSSLCAYIEEPAIDSYLGNDNMRFNSLVDTKSRSRIRIDSRVRKEPSHAEVIEYLHKQYPSVTEEMLQEIISRITVEWIENTLSEYPEDVLSHKKKRLIKKFLEGKLRLLRKLCAERKA